MEFRVRNDNFLERNETFLLNLSLPEASDAQLSARSSAVVTIINDDRKLTSKCIQAARCIVYLIHRITTFIFSRFHHC